jgi:hypothetical protein
MRITVTGIGVSLTAVLLSGCGSPSMNYRMATPQDALALTDGEILFRLRTTEVTLSAPAAADSKTTPSASGENLTLGTLTTRSKPAETLACSRYHLLRSHH